MSIRRFVDIGRFTDIARFTGAFKASARYALFFSPGLFFVSLGLCALVAPQLVVAAVAALFLFVGGLFVALAWKFLQFKRKFDSVARSIEAHIVIQPVERRAARAADRPADRPADGGSSRLSDSKSESGSRSDGVEDGSSKKIVYH